MKHPVILLALMASALPAFATTYKWVDEKGEVHYGDNIPPQYVNRGISELNKSGQVVKKTEPALTPEQQKARVAEMERKKEEEKRTEEQRRKDRALLGTYSVEQEIDLARDRNTLQIDNSIRAAEERQRVTREHVTDLKHQLEFYKGRDRATGKPRETPAHLLADLAQSEERLGVYDAVIEELGRQRKELIRRFAADRKRFSEIKLAGVGSLPVVEKPEAVSAERATTSFPISDATQPLINQCLGRWHDMSHRNVYAVSAEIAREYERVDLVLDARMGDPRGQFSAQRVVCVLMPDGKLDAQGTEIKKALASLGARY